MVGRGRFELPKSKDSGFTVRPIWPLWYLPVWSWLRESNPQPPDYKSGALPVELSQQDRANADKTQIKEFVKLTLLISRIKFKEAAMKKTNCTHYFSPGPASLPPEVKNRIHKELLDTFRIGVSVLEISHRSPQYGALNDDTLALCREVFQVPKTHSILLSVCGAQQHFSLIPLHLSLPGETIAYAKTGNWAQFACDEAIKYNRDFQLVYDGSPTYQSLGDFKKWKIPKKAKYLHLTINNTVYGTEYAHIPTYGNTPLVLDMTSSLAARTDIPWDQTGLIYASAQKNFGIAGVSVVIMRNDVLEESRSISKQNKVGKAFCYPKVFDTNSILNTPPVFAVYCLNRTLKWIKKIGGVKEMEKRAIEKARLVYSVMDKYSDFYLPYVDVKDRSRHNFVFKMETQKREKHFIHEALKENIREIKGYHTTGGIRASMYNGVSVRSAKVFAQFMEYYKSKFF